MSKCKNLGDPNHAKHHTELTLDFEHVHDPNLDPYKIAIGAGLFGCIRLTFSCKHCEAEGTLIASTTDEPIEWREPDS